MQLGSLQNVLQEFALEDLHALDKAMEDGIGDNAGALAGYKYKYLDTVVHSAIKYAEDIGNKKLLSQIHTLDDIIEGEIENAGVAMGPVDQVPLLIAITSAISMMANKQTLDQKIAYISGELDLSKEVTSNLLHLLTNMLQKSGVE